MSPEERQMLVDLFERVRANAAGPRDPQAENLINDAVRSAPFAPYVLAQTVLVQQQALEGAAKRISELESQARQPAPQQETSFLGGLGRSLFGGGSSPTPPPSRGYDSSAYQRGAPQSQPSYAPPPPSYAPQPQAGPWGAPAAPPAGGGFMSGALRTAAGVAGGVVLGNALEGMLGGRGGGLFGGGGGAFGGESGVHETVNNYYEAPDSGDQSAANALQDANQDQDDDQDASDDGGYDNSGDTDI
jgi:hypothetical protein